MVYINIMKTSGCGIKVKVYLTEMDRGEEATDRQTKIKRQKTLSRKKCVLELTSWSLMAHRDINSEL